MKLKWPFFRLPLIFVGYLLSMSTLYGQEVIMDNLRSAKGEISFDYQINSDHSSRERYTIFIYTSADDFKQPLNISIKEVLPDELHTFTFKGAQYLPAGYSGALRLKLVAEATVFPVIITDVSKKVKPGGALEISWKDAERGHRYDVQLIKDGQITSIAHGIPDYSFSGNLPSTMEKGNYKIQVVPQLNSNNASDMLGVSVVSKIGMGMKVAGALVVGGVGILVARGGGEDGLGKPLPGPPSPPDN